MVLIEELERARLPSSGASASAWLLAPEIIRHGSCSLQKELLPRIAAGEVKFALGYSEPEAGSDLTSLRTWAVRDGDDYAVTGPQLWALGPSMPHISRLQSEPIRQPRLLPSADLDCRADAMLIGM